MRTDNNGNIGQMRSKKKNKKHKSRIFIGIGVLLIAAALLLTGYNVWRNHRAGAYSAKILSAIEKKNFTAIQTETGRSLYEMYPEMEMPTVMIDGQAYIGVLKIPALGLELPVLSEWSYTGLNLAPCRYKGSAYQGNLIIAAHNFRQHFGNLQNLGAGEPIEFTDADGNHFQYQTAEIEVLPGTAVEEMESGEWELTLFTCDYSGRSRMAVRCVEVGE